MMSYEEALKWARLREELPAPDDFYVYVEAYKNKAHILLGGLHSQLLDNYAYVYYNAFTHYCLVTDYSFEQEVDLPEGDTETKIIYNPGYRKYKIGEKGFIVSSVSDESSSASIHVTQSMNEGDFLMTDLVRTPYGMYVYSVLEQLSVCPVLL